MLSQISVSGCHDADIDCARARLSQATHLALLQDPEQHPLSGSRQIPDLVEEDSPAVRRLEDSSPVLFGTGEGTTSVTEQLSQQQVLLA